MPGFKIHISASTTLGIGYGFAAYTLYGVPLPTAALGTTLCSVAGMLPDLDSGPGRPMRESITAAAAAIPMMMVDRFRVWGWPHESMILAGAAMYLFIRFGVGHTLKHWTVHRGIFHSFPVALIFTELAFLVCSSGDLHMRYFKAGGITIGFLSHLILDEIWSIDFRHARLKSSFGTALKFWCPCWWSNTIAYATTAAISLLTLNDPVWIDAGGRGQELHQVATTILQRFVGAETLGDKLEADINQEGEAAGAEMRGRQMASTPAPIADSTNSKPASRATTSQETAGQPPASKGLFGAGLLPSWGKAAEEQPQAMPRQQMAPQSQAQQPAANAGSVRFVERKSFADPPPTSAPGQYDGWNR